MTAPITKVNEPLSPEPRRRPLAAIGNPMVWTATAIVCGALAITVADRLLKQSLRQRNEQAIATLLAAKASAANLWLENQISLVDRCLSPQTSEALKSWLIAANANPGSQNPAPIREFLERLRELGDLDWCVLDGNGTIVDSSQENLKGLRYPSPESSVPQQFSGKTSIVFPETTLDEVAWSLALHPIATGMELHGGIAIMFDNAASFSELIAPSFEVTTSHRSAAILQDGRLLSRSPDEEALYSSGHLPSQKSSVLNHEIRNLTLPDKPWTRLAEQVSRRSIGQDVVGYSDHLGRTVIGGWYWIPEHNFALATETPYAHAHRPLILFRWLVAVTIGCFVVAAITWRLLLRSQALQQTSTTDRLLRRRLGQYVLGHEVGRGGMGKVFHGRHQLLQRDVAIKVLENQDATDRAMSRFEREVQMTAKLRHPNTIEIYDYGQTGDGTFFYVMEFVPGISLQELVDHYGRQPSERVIYLLRQICASLSEAHEQGMVHRDIKPANIMISSQAGLYDMVKVLDFGLVKEMNHETVQVTQTGAVTGTPLYMSPESVRDASQASQQSDVYSLGAVGYTLLTGCPTFEGQSSADICAMQLKQDPLRPSKRIGQSLPVDLQNLIMNCLRRSPDERPLTMTELSDALGQCQDANRWSQVDACQWWEQVFDGPRDAPPQFGDNQHHADEAQAPRAGEKRAFDINDTKIDEVVDPTQASANS